MSAGWMICATSEVKPEVMLAACVLDYWDAMMLAVSTHAYAGLESSVHMKSPGMMHNGVVFCYLVFTSIPHSPARISCAS